MLKVLKFAAAAGVQRPAARSRPLRRVLRAVLFRAALLAVRLAARLEGPAAHARARPAGVASIRPYAPAGAVDASLIEAVVYLAVAALFVAGLLGVFVA
jgi:hypothetical protein